MNGVEDLKKFIEEEISKKRAKVLVQNTSEPEQLASALWGFVLLNQHPLSWRAMWFMEHLAAENREYARPYLNAIVVAFSSFKFDGQKRSGLKILLMFSVTDYDYEMMLNTAFDLLLSNDEPIAVRMHAMRLLLEIVKLEPELKEELKKSINFIMPYAQKGLLSASSDVLKRLERI